MQLPGARRAASFLLAALIAAPAALLPAGPSAVPASAATSARFRLDLAEGRDFVAQTNFVQCVGASMQMMLNIMDVHEDRTARRQLELQNLARELSGPARSGFTRKGASVRGWSAGLNQLGAGPFRLVGTTTIDEALRLAAKAIRSTGKPVGLLVWSGRHAWVMSGFQATADPRRTSSFRVTQAIVLDPLYPYGSSKWGPSPRPREAISVATLGKQFVPRRRGTWAGASTGTAGATMTALAGKYVIVMPYNPIPFVRGRHLAA
jgi:hypothetical protein